MSSLWNHVVSVRPADCGFSDGNIRYYEYEGDALHFLNEYKSSDPRELPVQVKGIRALTCGSQNEV